MTLVPRLSQHFLTDTNILRRIVDALEPAPDSVVLEIGPGKGSLTRELLARGVRVIAVEKDLRLAAQLREWCVVSGESRLTVIAKDALVCEWHALLPLTTPHRPLPVFTIVGNIPYRITSPLIEKALTAPLPERIVFLVQAEVADRIVAAPGSKTYGALSVGVQAVCRGEKLFTVKAGAFRPPPRVQSAVLRLTPLAQPLIAPDDGPAFRAFVARCFSRRRKQLRNVIAGATARPPAEVAAGLARLGFDASARPEQLAPADFARLLRWDG